jgi:hypothetical protein
MMETIVDFQLTNGVLLELVDINKQASISEFRKARDLLIGWY